LLGFDIFVDKNKKPWLLEVNTPPALGIDCPTDEGIKPQLIRDILEVLDFEKYDDYVHKEEGESFKRKQKQNYFFKQRFKSQRNASVGTGSYHSSSHFKSGRLAKVQSSDLGRVINHNSLVITHERLGIKSHPPSYPNANFSVGVTSPSSIESTSVTEQKGQRGQRGQMEARDKAERI